MSCKKVVHKGSTMSRLLASNTELQLEKFQLYQTLFHCEDIDGYQKVVLVSNHKQNNVVLSLENQSNPVKSEHIES